MPMGGVDPPNWWDGHTVMTKVDKNVDALPVPNLEESIVLCPLWVPVVQVATLHVMTNHQ